jgi:hypothetical protein
VDAGWTGLRLLDKDPLYDSFRNEPEFNQIIDGVRARMSEMKRHAEELDKD